MKLYAKRIARLTVLLFVLLLAPAATANADYTPDALIPLGVVTGIEVATDGVVVTGFTWADSPAALAGIKAGDIITAVGSKKVSSGSDLRYICAHLSTEKIEVTVCRDGRVKNLSIMPQDMGLGRAELGIMVRDGLSGIGTITFVEPRSGLYGALGHGVTDAVSGGYLPLRGGSLTRSVITGIVPGVAGTPGKIIGISDGGEYRGSVDANTPFGIFGITDDESLTIGEPIPVADPSEVEKGEAYILSNIGGEGVRQYEIQIVKLYGNTPDGRNMSIKVTDTELLTLTGGIVQGMSGSPIIQDGKLVGAVTHVLVNDPAMGYGIFIQNMLDAAE